MLDEVEGFVGDADTIQPSCELPAARRRRLVPDNDEEEEEEGGWICPICPLTDRHTRLERLPPCIAEFREALKSQPKILPEPEACRILSDMFNRTCYESNRRRTVPVPGIHEMFPGDVQRHLEHSMHLKSQEDHMLDDCIWYTLQLRRQVERTGLWFESTNHEAKLDSAGFVKWCRAMETLKKLVELRHRFHGSSLEGIHKKFSAKHNYTRSLG